MKNNILLTYFIYFSEKGLYLHKQLIIKHLLLNIPPFFIFGKQS